MTRQVDPTGRVMQGVNNYWQQLDDDEIERDTHRGFVGGMWDEIGQFQFDHLVGEGLAPSHHLLDVGCGALRGGVHFVRYLDAGHYCGIDVNASLLKAGEVELARAGLADRGARLLADAEFHVASFETSFDFALAVSVFTHLSGNHIQMALSRVSTVLAPGAGFYATFFQAPADAHLDPITHPRGGTTTYFERDPYHQSFDELAVLGDRAGLTASLVGDFGHPRGQHLVVFRAPGSPS